MIKCLTELISAVKLIYKKMVNFFTKNRLKALSQTFLDFCKILFAALVAADFVKFTIKIKFLIVAGLIVMLITGLAIRPNKDGEE